jgi:hypothetical protein
MIIKQNAIFFTATLTFGAVFSSQSFAAPLTGTASSGVAVTGTATSGATGMSATSDSGYGLTATSNTGNAIFGASASPTPTTAGIIGGCQFCAGVVGESTNYHGMEAFSQTSEGLYASGGFNGVYGTTTSTNGLAAGVHGASTNAGNAMFAEQTGTGTGLLATSTSGNAILAASSSTDATIVSTAGTAAGAAGVKGKTNGSGTYGVASFGDLFVRGWAGTPGNAYKPGGGSWMATSDARVKRDIVSFTPALTELQQIHPVRFKYNGLGGTTDNGREYVGVVAQDLEKVLPFMVTSQKKKLRDSDAKVTDIKQVDPSAFTYLLINAVKELSDQNKALVQQVGVLNEQSKRMGEIAELMCRERPASKACSTGIETRTLASAQK